MINLTDDNFEKEVQTSKKPILVDFFAEWCPPCKMLSPILERLEKEYAEKVVFAKINVDLAPQTSQKFQINPIPTVILLKEGKPVSGFVGLKAESEIREWLDENLTNGENEKIEKLINEYEEYTLQNGIKLNPDREIVERIIRGLLEREKKYGKRYCPCRRVANNPEEDKKIVCPCQFMRMEIEKLGHCLCGLFVK